MSALAEIRIVDINAREEETKKSCTTRDACLEVYSGKNWDLSREILRGYGDGEESQYIFLSTDGL